MSNLVLLGHFLVSYANYSFDYQASLNLPINLSYPLFLLCFFPLSEMSFSLRILLFPSTRGCLSLSVFLTLYLFLSFFLFLFLFKPLLLCQLSAAQSIDPLTHSPTPTLPSHQPRGIKALSHCVIEQGKSL